MPDLVFGTKGVAETVGAAEKLRDAIEAQATATDTVSRSQQNFDRIAQRIMTRNESAQDRYNRLILEAKKAYEQNQISAISFEKEIESIGREIGDSTGRFKKFADQQDDAFGDRGQGLMRSWLGGFANVQAALELGKKMIEEINGDIQRGAERSKEGRRGISALRQVSGGSQEEFERLTGLARGIFASGATDSLDEAGRSMFSLASAGLADARTVDLFKRLGARADVDIETLARATKTQLAAFGQEETGEALQIISKALAASSDSPFSASQVLEAGARSAGGAGAIGISDEENLAALALLASSFGSASEAATALASLFKNVDLSGQFQGKDLNQIIQEISGQNLDTQGLKELLKEGTAIRAFRDLERDDEGYVAALSKIRNADKDTSAIERMLGLSDPATDAALSKMIADAEADLANEIAGGYVNLLSSVQRKAQTNAYLRNGRFASGVVAAYNFGADAVNFFTGGERNILQQISDAGKLVPEDQRTFEGLNKGQAELEELKRTGRDSLGVQGKMLEELQRIKDAVRRSGGLQGVPG